MSLPANFTLSSQTYFAVLPSKHQLTSGSDGGRAGDSRCLLGGACNCTRGRSFVPRSRHTPLQFNTPHPWLLPCAFAGGCSPPGKASLTTGLPSRAAEAPRGTLPLRAGMDFKPFLQTAWLPHPTRSVREGLRAPRPRGGADTCTSLRLSGWV